MSGHIQPTRLAVLIGMAVLTGAIAWGGALVYNDQSGNQPGVPWTAVFVLAFLAAVVFAIALVLRTRLAALRAGRVDARPVDPGFAARSLGLAKASALVGAVIVGVYAFRAYVDREATEDEVEREIDRRRPRTKVP